MPVDWENGGQKLVPEERIELSTYPLPRGCATTTLLRHRRALGPVVPAHEAAGAGAITQAIPQGKGVMTTASDARKDRLAAALRENLKRRKQRARALVGQSQPAPPGTGDGADGDHSDSLAGQCGPKGAEKPL